MSRERTKTFRAMLTVGRVAQVPVRLHCNSVIHGDNVPAVDFEFVEFNPCSARVSNVGIFRLNSTERFWYLDSNS
jgi:hypothetical protein